MRTLTADERGHLSALLVGVKSEAESAGLDSLIAQADRGLMAYTIDPAAWISGGVDAIAAKIGHPIPAELRRALENMTADAINDDAHPLGEGGGLNAWARRIVDSNRRDLFTIARCARQEARGGAACI